MARYYVAKGRAMLAGPGRQCPICGWRGREFHPFIVVNTGLWRTKAACPGCGSLDRHRALFFAYREYFSACPSHRRMLHFAPERCFRQLFRQYSAHYITSNHDREVADLKLDLSNLGIKTASLDLVVANGVMSCVGNHRRAVDNLFRVLIPDGCALLCDIVDPDGHSADSAVNAHGQLRHFGGRDLAERFAPFTAELVDLMTFVTAADRERFGIRRDNFYLIRLVKRVSGC